MDAMGKELDYLNVLRAVNEIPFGVGKTLLSDFLIGDDGNDSIKRHRLYKLPSFGSLAYSKEELNGLIESLILNGFLEVVSARDNKFLKLLSMTERGKKELLNPGMYNNNRLRLDLRFKKTEITAEDRLLFSEFGDFLSKFNDEQKKAIVSAGKGVLCIAGDGSGKTTVLTKRIEFLVRYRSVEPSKILAITFTRKARQEMMTRLGAIGGLEQVDVQTFNSFCEKALNRHNDVAYDKKFRVLTYGDRLKIMARALLKMNFSVDDALGIYFTESQKSGKIREQLISIFVNDCFFIRD
jgi:hypothetical protein